MQLLKHTKFRTPWRERNVSVIMIVFLFYNTSILGCSKAEEKTKISPEADAEQSLLADIPRAILELKQRLRERALIKDRFLILSGYMSVNHFEVFPTVPPYKIVCGASGLELIFSYGSSPDDHSTVNLTQMPLTIDQCTSFLGPVSIDTRNYLTALSNQQQQTSP